MMPVLLWVVYLMVSQYVAWFSLLLPWSQYWRRQEHKWYLYRDAGFSKIQTEGVTFFFSYRILENGIFSSLRLWMVLEDLDVLCLPSQQIQLLGLLEQPDPRYRGMNWTLSFLPQFLRTAFKTRADLTFGGHMGLSQAEEAARMYVDVGKRP